MFTNYGLAFGPICPFRLISVHLVHFGQLGPVQSIRSISIY